MKEMEQLVLTGQTVQSQEPEYAGGAFFPVFLLKTLHSRFQGTVHPSEPLKKAVEAEGLPDMASVNSDVIMRLYSSKRIVLQSDAVFVISRIVFLLV